LEEAVEVAVLLLVLVLVALVEAVQVEAALLEQRVLQTRAEVLVVQEVQRMVWPVAAVLSLFAQLLPVQQRVLVLLVEL
jgi:hypothetical protein